MEAKLKVITNLDMHSFQHEEDISTIKMLDAIPGFKTFMLKVVCPLQEKCINIEYHGNGFRVTKDSLPELDGLLEETCRILGNSPKPEMSLMWHYDIAATSEGAQAPHITALSGVVDLLEKEEIQFLLGHEVGHQMCGHKPYHMFLECMYMPIMNTIPGGKEWIALVRTKLLQWYRISDFTADRAGLLACQDINTALRVLMKMAGVPIKYYPSMKVEAFIKQAQQFDLMFNGVTDNIVRFISLNAESHPWLVIRASELYKWYKSGKYEEILCKQ